jgi:hypothetical protein
LDLYIQAEQPSSGTSNWLPAPASGPFMVFIRTCQPHQSLIDGSYRLPPIVAA